MDCSITYVDLFCGAGGMSLGFNNAGLENVLALDFDPDSCNTYKKNFPGHKVICADIRHIDSDRLLREIDGRKVDVIIGGPPCQGFSIAGRIGRRFEEDPRNELFKEFARVVGLLKPSYFVMENVARLYTHRQGKTRTEIIDTFCKLGYNVDVQILKSEDFGVPQKRRRTIFIGNRLGLHIKFPQPLGKKTTTVRETLESLPRLNSGDESQIPNHNAMNHGEAMLEKMKYVPDGGDRSSIPKGLRPTKGDVRKYIRYKSDEPSICITGDMRKVFHYEQNRALTVRELARLQSFPDDFLFLGNSISQQQQVGNAVPPLLAEAIAKSLIKSLTGSEE